MRSEVWDESIIAIMFLPTNTSTKTKEKCLYQFMVGDMSTLPTSLKIFGDMDIVSMKDDIQGKLQSRGKRHVCLWVTW